MAVHPRTLEIATDLIERFEGVEFRAYLDPIGIPTICAGVTVYPGGQPVRMGDECSSEVCKGYLNTLLHDKYVPALERIPGWERLGPNRQAVLLSFAWNLGASFYGTAGFETITRVLRDGATRPEVYEQMGDALALYVNAGGRKLAGLVERRKREAEIWKLETDSMQQFTALQDTSLKVAPIDSKFLTSLGKRPFTRGQTVKVSRVDEIPQDSHAWFTLEETGDRLAAFLPHWKAGPGSPASVAPQGDIDFSDFAAPVGKFITVGEVLQYDSRRRPAKGSKEEQAIIDICKEFDRIRAAWDGPIGVTSGYRPEPINSQVGGVRNSYHVRGMALDIYPVDASIDKFYDWLSKRWSGGLGDGRKRGFVHIDTRDGGRFNQAPVARPAAAWLY